ncbi:hypothetical protein CDAR_321651 [Caerostris darwini]|uniref:Ribosomal protein S19 n=1 Tax=Caerostris darwini TaxID=1538125 RepID=A0AAV4VU59_9ARAC|nr:hypothetical protein CDAR_321651 [Caerostris darwini]
MWIARLFKFSSIKGRISPRKISQRRITKIINHGDFIKCDRITLNKVFQSDSMDIKGACIRSTQSTDIYRDPFRQSTKCIMIRDKSLGFLYHSHQIRVKLKSIFGTGEMKLAWRSFL